VISEDTYVRVIDIFRSFHDSLQIASHDTRPTWKDQARCGHDCDVTQMMIFIKQE
jgi:hypothetical protein